MYVVQRAVFAATVVRFCICIVYVEDESGCVVQGVSTTANLVVPLYDIIVLVCPEPEPELIVICISL